MFHILSPTFAVRFTHASLCEILSHWGFVVYCPALVVRQSGNWVAKYTSTLITNYLIPNYLFSKEVPVKL